MNRTVEWLINIVAGIAGGAIGTGAALLMMAWVGAVSPFNPLGLIFYLAIPFLGGFGAIIGSNFAGRFIDRRNNLER